MEGGGNVFDHERNPLLIELVLNILFDHLRVKELTKCREVCSLWNSSVLASRSWKREVKIYVSNKDGNCNVEKFLKLIESGNRTCLSETYTFDGYLCSEPFWSQCGASIKKLNLTKVKFESVDDFRRIIYRACLNMTELSLDNIKVTLSESEGEVLEPTNYLEPQFGEHKNMRVLELWESKKSYGVSWMELLSHFPNLKALHLKDNIPNISGLFASLKKIRERFPDKLNLKHIGSMKQVPEFLDILRDPALELQTIETSLCRNVDDLRDILTRHAPSLKKLWMWYSSGEAKNIDPCKIFPLQSTQLRFVGLDGLQVLELHYDIFSSLEVLKFTPNLRILKITAHSDEVIANTKLSNMREVSLKKCQQLLCCQFTLSLESLSKLIIWIPNVEELSMDGLTNDHFQMICQSWPRLITLIGISTKVDDLGITGLDEEDVLRINGHEENSSWRPITVPRANITALKGLRNLFMGNDKGNGVGYCGAVCGIEKLPKLERLRFELYKLKGRIWDSLHSRFPKSNFFLPHIEDYTSTWDFRLR